MGKLTVSEEYIAQKQEVYFHTIKDFTAEVQLEGMNLTIGGRKVLSYDYWCDQFPTLKGNVPSRYTVRFNKEKDPMNYPTLITTFDLIEDDKGNTCWMCGYRENASQIAETSRYKTVAQVVKILDDHFGRDGWHFHVEEPTYDY